MTAGTPGHMYLADRQEKCLERKNKGGALQNAVGKVVLFCELK